MFRIIAERNRDNQKNISRARYWRCKVYYIIFIFRKHLNLVLLFYLFTVLSIHITVSRAQKNRFNRKFKPFITIDLKNRYWYQMSIASRALSYLIETRTRRNSWNSRNYDCNHSDVSDFALGMLIPSYIKHRCIILLCVLKFTISVTAWLYTSLKIFVCYVPYTRSHFAYVQAAFLGARLTR